MTRRVFGRPSPPAGGPKRSRWAQRYKAITDAFFNSVDRQQTRRTRQARSSGVADADPKTVSLTGDGIRAVGFRERLRGYDPTRVDDLLERVAKELEAGRSASPLLRNVDLGQKWRGYDPADVDELIARLTASSDP